MANSFVRYTGNNSTTSYSIPFSYRATSDLTVTLSGVVTTAYTLNSAGTTLTFNTAPAQDVAIEIRRRTSQGTKLVDYASGSVLTENDLDTDSDQAFFMSQEAIDDAGDVIKVSNTNFQWDVQNKRLTNVANPVNDTDAVNKQFISTNLPNITTVAGISADVTTVAGISSNVTTVANDTTNIGTVATNMPSITTVATNINDVIKVADDLNEAISEVETVANDLNEATSEIEVVANNIVNVNTVGTINADVTTVANNETDIQTLADLEDGTVTTNGLSTLAGLNTEIQGVYNIRTNVTNVDTNSANVNLVAGQISPTNNVSAVSAVATEIGTLGALGTEITNLNNIRTDITGVNNIAPAVTAVNNNSANINTVAGLDTEITALGASGTVASINTVASNLASVNNFGEVYRISATAPTTSLDNGDMWFDTTAGKLKIWNGSSFDLAGSSINGTSARFKYTATASQTTFTGADDNGNTLAYDSGFTDVYLNGVKLVNGSDYTATDGSNVVLTTGASVNDILEIVGFGTFSVADFDASGLTGTINIARLADNSVTNAKLANQSITINGSAVNLGGSVTVGETKPTISSISPSTITNAQTSITITGSNFTSVPQVEFLNPSTGIWYVADTVTYNNSTSLTVNATLGVDGTYKIRIENPDGNAVISSTNILTVSDAPTWTTASGTLGTFAGDFSGTLATVVATSDSAVTFSEVGSNLATANVTLSSGGVLSTTDFGGSSTTATTYNFTIRATDAENQTADRNFSLTSSFGATGGGQFN
ncbi:tail fiber [Pelagibacter phage HTVC201P]|nr:tail fiber [Pelagibacter phage HTVC201P]